MKFMQNADPDNGLNLLFLRKLERVHAPKVQPLFGLASPLLTLRDGDNILNGIAPDCWKEITSGKLTIATTNLMELAKSLFLFDGLSPEGARNLAGHLADVVRWRWAANCLQDDAEQLPAALKTFAPSVQIETLPLSVRSSAAGKCEIIEAAFKPALNQGLALREPLEFIHSLLKKEPKCETHTRIRGLYVQRQGHSVWLILEWLSDPDSQAANAIRLIPHPQMQLLPHDGEFDESLIRASDWANRPRWTEGRRGYVRWRLEFSSTDFWSIRGNSLGGAFVVGMRHLFEGLPCDPTTTITAALGLPEPPEPLRLNQVNPHNLGKKINEVFSNASPPLYKVVLASGQPGVDEHFLKDRIAFVSDVDAAFEVFQENHAIRQAARSWILHQTKDYDVLGTSLPLSLDSLFCDSGLASAYPIAEQAESEGEAAMVRRSHRYPHDATEYHDEIDNPVGFEKAFSNMQESTWKSPPYRMAILGKSGAGKTTLLRRLARHTAHAAEGPGSFPLKERSLIPILISLKKWEGFRKLRSPVREDSEESLGSFVSAELATYLSKERTGDQRLFGLLTGSESEREGKAKAMWDRATNSGGIFLLLDGLDEVSPEFLTHIHDALNVFPAECPVAVTCIPEHRKRLTTIGIPNASLFFLNGFDSNQQDTLLKSLVDKGQFPYLRGYRRLDAMMNQIYSSSGLVEMANNPRLLLLIAFVADQRKALPARRTELYGAVVEELVKEMITHERAPSVERSRYQYKLPEGFEQTVVNILAETAYTCLCGASDMVSTLRGVVNNHTNFAMPEEEVAHLVTDLLNNSRIISGPDGVKITILHPSLQAYLAGDHLSRFEWEEMEATVDQYAQKTQWTDAIIFLAGRLRVKKEEHLRRRLLICLNAREKDDLSLHRLALAAQCLPA